MLRVVLVCLMTAWGWAQPLPKLRVAVTGGPPFFVKLEGNEARGICPAFWEACADLLKTDSEYTVCATAEEALEQVRSGKADLAIGTIPLTSADILQNDFTLPYQVVNIAALSRVRDATLYDRLRPFLSSAVLIGSATLTVVLLLVGLAMWLLERTNNPTHFPRGASQGLEEGVWFAITTATSVGYGDRFPITRLGRLVAAIWMLVAGIAFSAATALFSTALTLSHIPAAPAHSISDLMGKRLAVIKGSVTEQNMRYLEASLYPADDLNEAIGWVRDKRVQMVLSTTLALNYYLRTTNLESEFKVQELAGRAQLLCFALPKNSPLTEKLNQTLLILHENGKLQHISAEWINQLALPD
ncbi:transporter substrate-binding domain-containing protein [bacterium]|nr:transporter substrate-binding domain-containing protein [bacterium]